MEALSGKIDLCDCTPARAAGHARSTRHRLRSVCLDQQMNGTHVAGAGGELLLHLVEVVNLDNLSAARAAGQAAPPSGVRW